MAEKVCSVWVGYLLTNPLRKLTQNPQKILGPYIKEGMKVLDVGCAMGFFSLPLAKMVGVNGKVICVDIQEKMLKALERRAKRAGLSGRIETRVCRGDCLCLDGLEEKIDFVLASAVVHEVADASDFFSEVYKVIKPSGRILVAEPRLHVSKKDFESTISISQGNGFTVFETPKMGRSRAVLLGKKQQRADTEI